MSSSELVMVAGGNFCNDEVSSTAAGMRKDYLKDKKEELELGLYLGGKKKDVLKPYDTGGVDYCRILTAEDLSSPSSMVRAQLPPPNRPRPYSSCSSSSGSSSSSLLMGVGIQGSSKNPSVDDDSTASVAVTAKQLVGWPPVRAYRKNSLVNQTSKRTNSSFENNPDAIQHKKPFVVSQAPHTHHRIIEEEAIFQGKKKVIPHFVKVNMDGDPIGRKVDLNSYSSYTTLCISLEDMFRKISEPSRTCAKVTNASKLLDGSSEFLLTYEDKDEDWMLVGDVPWRLFLATVRRLRIMRRSETNGIC